MRRLLLLLLLLVFAGAELGPVMAQGIFGQRPDYYQQRQYQRQQQLYQQQYQQQYQPPPRRRTLFDMLFGPRDNGQYQQPQQQVAPPVRAKPAPPKLPPAKPAIAKADGATRVAVFGDSLAADLGKALDRLYANDPTVAVLQQAVPSSGFAKPNYFDWDRTIGEQIKANSFDVAVMMIGVNDRQSMTVDGKSLRPLTDDWNKEYTARVTDFLKQLRAANKPVVWVGLPPVAPPQLSDTLNQISSLERLAVFGSGGQFVDIYDKFLDDNGNYSANGPDVDGQDALMRRSDGIHFTNAGADKLAFYASQLVKLVAHGGAGLAISDPLAGTDAAALLRPPYQGLGQGRLLQLAGAVIPLTGTESRANELVQAGSSRAASGFDMKQLLDAPVGRADAFGAGIDPEKTAAQPVPPVAAVSSTSPAALSPVAAVK